MFQDSGSSGGNNSSSALDRKYSALVNLEDILMDDDLGPMSKCDPMLSSPDNPLHTLSSGLSSSAALQLSSSSSMSSGGSSSSRCSSVDNLESLESSHGSAGLNNLDGAAYVATRGRPPTAAASSGRRRGPAMKRLHERNGGGGAERTENVRLPRAEVFMGAPPRQQRIPVVTRTSIITSTAAAAQPPPPPPAFSMIFPLPEEISQLSDEFMPSSSAAAAAATSPTFRTVNHHHHQHQLRNDGANHNQNEASPSSLSSPKQVSLEILPGACLSHHDLGGFFITAGAATSASEPTEMSSTETLSERCLSLDDLRAPSSASSNCIGFQPGATMTAGSSGSSNAVVARAASAAATYSLHPLGGVQSSYVHHQLGACKKVILEERPITPHGSGVSGHHNTDSKVYLRL
jgi:hypothetical protein